MDNAQSARRPRYVIFNGAVIGTLEPDARREYSFTVPAAGLFKVNTLSFRFADATDGMSLSSPVVTVQNAVFRDPRDQAIRGVRTAHWGSTAHDWGGFIVGNAAPPDETPFHHRQNVFCFVFDTTPPAEE